MIILFRSWNSLKIVRKKHFASSQSSGINDLGYITQYGMVLTQFGFMGYALIRPQLLGIKNDSTEDLEGFVHFWAVVGYMLGVKDEFNMCFHSLEVVKV